MNLKLYDFFELAGTVFYLVCFRQSIFQSIAYLSYFQSFKHDPLKYSMFWVILSLESLIIVKPLPINNKSAINQPCCIYSGEVFSGPKTSFLNSFHLSSLIMKLIRCFHIIADWRKSDSLKLPCNQALEGIYHVHVFVGSV